jgi:hypothetical protein
MSELAALHVKINGDASGLHGALSVAEGGLERVGAQAVQAQRQVANTSTGMGRLGQVFQRNSFAISNAANQFSDLAVQMSMGVPASRALSQQLPQMTAFMGPLATVIGVASGVLIGLAGNFLASRDNAVKLKDALERLERITGDLDRANDILNMSLYDLTTQYGDYANEVLRAARSVASLAQAEAAQRLATVIADVDRALDGFTQRSGSAFRSGTMLSTAIGNIADQFKISRNEARLFEAQFRALETATTFEDQVAALRAIEELMMQSGVEASKLPPELITALQQLNQMVFATAEVEAALNNAAEAGANLSRSLPQTTGGIGPGLFNADGSVALPPNAAGETQPLSVLNGGGNLANQIERDLEQLREGFMTQEELQIAAYESQQEILQEALERRLITQQEYNALMQDAQSQHQDRMSAIDVYRYGTGVQKTQQFMSQMASALQNGNEKMARISRVFAAGETLINAWRAHNQTLSDPTLPFFAKIPAALSILSAGMGAVNAIRGSGGAGGGGGGAGRAAASAAASQPAQLPTQTLRFDFGGQSTMGMEQIVGLLNDAYDRGYRIRAVMA